MSVENSSKQLVLASNNAGKIKEFSQLLADIGLQVIPQAQLGIAEAHEPHPTFVENALAKARHASLAAGLPALADDSGLVVPALNGAPGVHSARYAQLAGGAKSDHANNQHLLEQLRTIADRSAFYVAVLVYVSNPDDPCPLIASAKWHGEILTEPRGAHGFGYDPYFYIHALGLSVAEMEPAQKNRLSHRSMALQQLLSELRQII